MEGNRYNHSKVYKLINSIDDTLYIGSTTSELSKRLSYHRIRSNDQKYKNCKVYEHFNLIGFENVRIILIEEFKLENKEQLRREEQRYIDMYKHNQNCLNSMNALVTEEEKQSRKKDYRVNHKEQVSESNKRYRANNLEAIAHRNRLYYESHKEYVNVRNKEYHKANIETITEYQKQYKMDNKDKINEQRKKTYDCICGSTIRMDSKTKHERSLKHVNYMQGIKDHNES